MQTETWKAWNKQQETKLHCLKINWILQDCPPASGTFSHSSNTHEKFKALNWASENRHMKIIQQDKDWLFTVPRHLWLAMKRNVFIHKKEPEPGRIFCQTFDSAIKYKQAQIILWRIHQNPRDPCSLELLLHWSKSTFSPTLRLRESRPSIKELMKAVGRFSLILQKRYQLPEVSLTLADEAELGTVQTGTSFETIIVWDVQALEEKPLNLTVEVTSTNNKLHSARAACSGNEWIDS